MLRGLGRLAGLTLCCALNRRVLPTSQNRDVGYPSPLRQDAGLE